MTRGRHRVPGGVNADARLERILDESQRPGLDADDAALADLFAALRAPATEEELAGLSSAMAAFGATAATDPAPAGRGRRFVRRLIALPTAALVASGGIVAVAGVASAAYSGALPDVLQSIAHRAIGAPAPETDPGPTDRSAPATPVPPVLPVPPSAGPASTAPPISSRRPDPAATTQVFTGLCRAYRNGGLDRGSAGYARLEEAAGARSVAQLCDEVLLPASPPAPTHPTPTHPTPTHPARPLPPVTPAQPAAPVAPRHPVPTRPAHPARPATPTHTAPPVPPHPAPPTPPQTRFLNR